MSPPFPGILDSADSLRYHGLMAGNRLPEKARQNGDPLAVLFLVLLAALPYLNTLTNAFVYDDRQQVLENPYIHSFRYLGRIFGSTVWTFEGAQGATNYYRPLMTFAYLLAYKAFGLIPFGFHLMNLALHIAVVLLVFAVAERLFRDRLLSLVAAGLFALHPIHTESVAWIAGITDLELSVFFLLTFLLYLRLAKSESSAAPSWLSYLAILIAYSSAFFPRSKRWSCPLCSSFTNISIGPAPRKSPSSKSSAAICRSVWPRRPTSLSADSF